MDTILALRCPVCGGDDLTPFGDYAAFDNHISFKGGGTGYFNPDLKVKAGRARVCLRCGFLMLFLDDDERLKAREAVI